MATITNQEYQNVQNYVNSNYTADSLKSYSNAYKNYMSQGMSAKDAASKASSLLVKSNTSTASTPTSTQTTATQSSANRNTTSTATSTNNNRNTGTYVDSDGYTSATQRNMATSGAEFGRSNTTQNQTSTPATLNLSNTKNMWDNLSYDQQQEKLNQIPGLKDSLTKKGWTIKSPTTQGTQQTPSKSQTNPGQWDYQDNSDARMMEIANNLNGYRISNPELFNDWNTFSKFFIDGKGRSQDQINYLKDYFDVVKQYNGYDNMSAQSVGEMVARREIPEGYLNYIKYANPDRYAEIMNYKDQTEKGIMNETYYANLVNNSDLADPEWMKWAKENQFIIDENNDNLDDRLYHEATDEEKTLVNEYSTLASEQLADQNTYRDLMSDLREQYPDADESTLMILAGDRGKKIQDRMDTRNVTMTKLNGQITYLQNERTTQNNAGQQTINQLQKAYGMYYDYSPEGMSQLAQAKYAATNVTLDQADNGTDTQKQMALQSVLDDYYGKYGSIIQRSESQVIGDVMRYAKEKGVNLSQALEENFLKPLRSKPQFATLSSGGDLGYEPKIYKVGDNGYYFDENGNLVSIGGGTLGGGTGTMRTERNNNPTAMTTDVAKSLGLVEGVDYVQGDAFPNNPNLHTAKLIGDPIETTIKALDNGANSSSTHAFYTAGNKQRWTHTAMSDAEWLKLSDDQKKQVVLNMLQREGGDISKMAYYNEGGNGGNAGNGGNYDPALEPFLKADPTKFSSTQWKALKNMGYTETKFMQIRNGYLKNLASTPDATTKKILDTIGALITKYPGELALKSTMLGTDYVNNTLGNYITDYDFVKQNLTMDNLTRLKSQGATFGSLTEGERPRIENSASKLNKNKMSESAFKNELLDIYNVYAEKSGMGTLTLDDIYNMYNGSSSSGGTTKTSETSGTKSSSGGKKITNLGR